MNWRVRTGLSLWLLTLAVLAATCVAGTPADAAGKVTRKPHPPDGARAACLSTRERWQPDYAPCVEGDPLMCNLWWVWLLVGSMAGFVLTIGLGAVLMSGEMSREEEQRDRLHH